MPSIMKN